ncbi:MULTISPECIES: four-carbon acid sugar kinase family protein [Olivibacter]|uniref:Four-carbon acid sugar kinase family protein n=1 Tax=Olivibacter jilunii TaxID=985016 RepID=A0ABW6B785_9SPHI|nr:four-carbon acid sugar kinase family protein [Pseudosphingobacterium sp.]
MIIVIADDLTGATELGGVALRYNLQVEITNQIDVSITSGTDLLVINTDTRSMAIEQAMERLDNVLRWIKTLSFTHIFKKVDSVLRGHIVAELTAQMLAIGAKRALLLPANPRLGRTIRKGKYYVQDKPIHETAFSCDPEFPVKNANVLEMLGAQGDVQIKSWSDTLPAHGLVVGEIATEQDISKWVQIAPEDTLLAGGSSAFIAFLEHKAKALRCEPLEENKSFTGFRRPSLYICGSNYEKSIQRIKAWRMVNEPVCYLPISKPGENMDEEELYRWMERVKAALMHHQKAIIAFDNELVSSMPLTPSFLRISMAKIVDRLLNEVTIQELIIEGGATAGTILAHRQIGQLKPVEELAPGVIRCSIYKEPKIWITLKPGSYNWYTL